MLLFKSKKILIKNPSQTLKMSSKLFKKFFSPSKDFNDGEVNYFFFEVLLESFKVTLKVQKMCTQFR